MMKELYQKIEKYMQESMNDSAHDKEHIYRVLYMALEIAKFEENVNMEVLILACLLHDIGREEEYKNPSICHAQAGSEKAYVYLTKSGFNEKTAVHIKECIATHRYRKDNTPVTIEAKILFDADKLDVTGTLGIARTLLYKGIVAEPLYTVDNEGNVEDGSDNAEHSFFQEYRYKLEGIYDKFYTERAKQLAKERQKSAVEFYENMRKEVVDCYAYGKLNLKNALE